MRSKTQGKFLRYIKGPIRALARARDLYMQSLAAAAPPWAARRRNFQEATA